MFSEGGVQQGLKLNFVIVGGGIGGLATAFVLAKAGHHVTVLEKFPGLGVYAGGLRIPPNLSKILVDWLDPELLASISTISKGTVWTDLATGKPIGLQPWEDVITKEFGGEFLLISHAELHSALHDLATKAKAKVLFNSEVVSVTRGPSPKVTLASGKVFQADIVVGADGHKSLVRDVVLGHPENVRPSNSTMLTVKIPMDERFDDPELRTMYDLKEWPVLMGQNRSMCGQPIKATKEYALQIFSEDQDDYTSQIQETWDTLYPTDQIPFEKFGPKVMKLMKGVKETIRTRHMIRDVLGEWMDPSSRVVLLGEAAHGCPPGGTYGASMAVEDAVVFGTIFSHLNDWEEIPSFVQAYQDLRQKRRITVTETDLKTGDLVWLPPGPEREARDITLQLDRRKWKEEDMKRQFDLIGDVFCYDARDAAEDWWLKWGRLAAQARRTISSQLPLNVGYVRESISVFC